MSETKTVTKAYIPAEAVKTSVDAIFQADDKVCVVIDKAKKLGIKPKGLQDYLNDDPSLTEKKTYDEMKGLFCETD